MIRRILAVIVLSGISLVATADDLRPGYLEIRQTGEETYDVGWKVPARGTNLRLGLYVRFPPDTVILEDPGGRFERGAFIEHWKVTHPGGLDDQVIHIDGLRSNPTDVLLRLERLDGSNLVKRLDPSNTSAVLDASPSQWNVAGTYFVLGVEHILFGIDHLLFVLALVMLVKGTRRLIGTITAFTVAHSITLAGATLGWVNVPIAPVEAIIALSIVFVAAEIVHGKNGEEGLAARSPWIVAFAFGLLHGFGFAGALSEVGLPSNAIPVALLFFNVGVEIGQLLFVAAVVLFQRLASRPLEAAPQWINLAPAYAIGGLAMFWTLQRVTALG
jgi:hydrogenase/urease accessory protein HupE